LDLRDQLAVLLPIRWYPKGRILTKGEKVGVIGRGATGSGVCDLASFGTPAQGQDLIIFDFQKKVQFFLTFFILFFQVWSCVAPES
jgi:hypothetical protein